MAAHASEWARSAPLVGRSSIGLLLVVVLLLWASQVVDAAASACLTASTVPVFPKPPAGTCATYSNTLNDGSLGFCAGIVDYPYFLPNATTQAELEVAAQQAVLGSNPAAALLLTVLPPTCTAQLKRIACLAEFQACEYVDPFYLNFEACDGTSCTVCGNIETSPFTPISSSSLSPSYGSVCLGSSVPNGCIVGPGKVPGFGNIGWELANKLSGGSLTITEFCAIYHLVWISDFNSCMVAFPRSPCKSECDKSTNMDRTVVNEELVNATCPLISGNWKTDLTRLAASSDSFVQAQANLALNTGTNSSYSLSLLIAFGFAPNCVQTVTEAGETIFVFSEKYSQELSVSRAESSGVGIALQAVQLGGATPCACTINLATNSSSTSSGLTESTNMQCATSVNATTYCNHLETVTALCNSGGGAGTPNPTVRLAGFTDEGLLNPICTDVITNANNQPSELALLAASLGVPAAVAETAFFVPSAPGLPALATGEMTRNLCSFKNALGNGQVFTGTDSYECAVAQFNAGVGVIPGFLAGSCRASFMDLLCNQVFMKVDLNSLCLLPNNAACAPTAVQGASKNTIPFVFGLPRFPNNSLCTAFQSDCAGFISTLTPAQQGLIAEVFNCSKKILIETASNNIDSWTSHYWANASPFNGLSAYPVGYQVLANITALVGPYGPANGLNAQVIAATGVSPVAVATISAPGQSSLIACSCPFPLVVPDSPTDSGAVEGVCCNQRCEGQMLSPDNFNNLILVEKILPWFSFAGSLFIILTWTTFKVKRTQTLTLMFAIASFNNSLLFIIPEYYVSDPRDVWCKDNVTPNLQADGGMCLFQAIWLCYWTLCACSFWLMQSIDLYLRICHNKRHLEHIDRYYHLAGWGIPLVATIVLAATDSFGYSPNYYFCFMQDFNYNYHYEEGLELGVWYATIILCWLIGTTLMILVLYQIWKITSKTSSTAQISNSVMKRLSVYRTPIFFVFFFVYIWISIFSWRFQSAILLPAILDGATDWVTCLLTNYADGISDPAYDPAANNSILRKYGILNGTGCGDHYPNGISFGSEMYLVCIACLQGVFIFFMFGAKMENINLWRERLGLTTKKYDTTLDDSSSKDKPSKPSALTQAMTSMFSPVIGANKSGGNESAEKDGGSAVMVNGIQSGKFMAITEPTHTAQVAAAYMDHE